jgi:hypothetical protein
MTTVYRRSASKNRLGGATIRRCDRISRMSHLNTEFHSAIQLEVRPLEGAIAAGNCRILSPVFTSRAHNSQGDTAVPAIAIKIASWGATVAGCDRW